jgi:hypothetical protein
MTINLSYKIELITQLQYHNKSRDSAVGTTEESEFESQ